MAVDQYLLREAFMRRAFRGYEDTGLSRKELSASREDCYELSKEFRRDIRLARIPIGLVSPTARSFQLLPFGFLFS